MIQKTWINIKIWWLERELYQLNKNRTFDFISVEYWEKEKENLLREINILKNA